MRVACSSFVLNTFIVCISLLRVTVTSLLLEGSSKRTARLQNPFVVCTILLFVAASLAI